VPQTTGVGQAAPARPRAASPISNFRHDGEIMGFLLPTAESKLIQVAIVDDHPVARRTAVDTRGGR